MSFQEHMKEVLVVMYENLDDPKPKLISSDDLAEKLQVQLSEIRILLKYMEGLGVILTDPDLQHSLITREGVSWLQRRGIESRVYVKNMEKFS